MSKILIVDDDVSINMLLQTLVKMEGHIPTTVNDSTRVIDIASSVEPDLITLDLMMPGLSGFELCGLLHQHSGLAKIPILIVSARDDPESKERAIKAGAKDYLTKPFTADELMQKINQLTNSSLG